MTNFIKENLFVPFLLIAFLLTYNSALAQTPRIADVKKAGKELKKKYEKERKEKEKEIKEKEVEYNTYLKQKRSAEKARKKTTYS
jgi:Skp family chaperone for outer membrane proteins